jgi:hypothetical protein
VPRTRITFPPETHMRSVYPWAVGAVLCLTPSAVRAQNHCAEYLKWPAVGRWAEYKGVYNKKDPISSRYAVVGSEQRNGIDYKWIELKMHDDKKNRDMIYQMLVPGGGPLDLDKVEEVVLKSGDDRAMKMGGMMIKMMRGQLAKSSAFKDACTEVALVGEEKVSVSAGSFKANHFRSDKYETDSWVDASVPFSMIKSVGKSHEIELAASGDGAKSSITETPQEMPGLGPSK